MHMWQKKCRQAKTDQTRPNGVQPGGHLKIRHQACLIYVVFFGGKAKATASCSKWPLWLPSQKGLFCDKPQRQMETISLPCRLYTPPFLSTISKSPSTFIDPLLFTVIFVADMIMISFKIKHTYRNLGK